MSGTLSDRQRQAIAGLAAVILPGTAGHPAASEIDIEQAAIDRALRSRPDLDTAFRRLLDRFDGDANRFLRALTETEFNLAMTLICAAYLMHPSVGKALGYHGQQALTPNRGGFGAEELVLEMMQKPKRYRDA